MSLIPAFGGPPRRRHALICLSELEKVRDIRSLPRLSLSLALH